MVDGSGRVLYGVQLDRYHPYKVSGPVFTTAGGGLAAIGLATGRFVTRGDGDYDLHGRSPAGTVFAYDHDRKRYVALDPLLLKTVASTPSARQALRSDEMLTATPTGFLVIRPYRSLIAFGDDGRRRWRRRLPRHEVEVGTQGSYVYIQHRTVAHGRARFWVAIHSLRTGRRLGSRRGRLDLQAAASAGLTGLGEPLRGSSYISPGD